MTGMRPDGGVDVDGIHLNSAQVDVLADALYPRMIARRRRFELIVYAWLLVVLVGSTIALYKVFHDEHEAAVKAQAAAGQSYAACRRAVEFAVPLGQYFLRVGALNPEQDSAYQTLLPQHCIKP
jgi:hypothetical protein